MAIWRTIPGNNPLLSSYLQIYNEENFPSQTFVNEVSFTQYHLFRAEVRIVP